MDYLEVLQRAGRRSAFWRQLRARPGPKAGHFGRTEPPGLSLQVFRDPPVRHDPEQQQKCVNDLGDVDGSRREGDGHNVEHAGQNTPPAALRDRPFQHLTIHAAVNDRLLDQRIAHAGHQQHDPVGKGRDPAVGMTAHPAGHKRQQRDPEEKKQIGPEDPAVHRLDRLKGMVMVVPVSAHIYKTHGVHEDLGDQAGQVRQTVADGRLHADHRDRDNDGQNAIRKSFHSISFHKAVSPESKKSVFTLLL